MYNRLHLLLYYLDWISRKKSYIMCLFSDEENYASVWLGEHYVTN